MFPLIITWFINLSHLFACLDTPQLMATKMELSYSIPKNVNTLTTDDITGCISGLQRLLKTYFDVVNNYLPRDKHIMPVYLH
jgi:hypothetical protein